MLKILMLRQVTIAPVVGFCSQDMCTIMDNLPKFEDRISEDTKMALIYILLDIL